MRQTTEPLYHTELKPNRFRIVYDDKFAENNTKGWKISFTFELHPSVPASNLTPVIHGQNDLKNFIKTQFPCTMDSRPTEPVIWIKSTQMNRAYKYDYCFYLEEFTGIRNCLLEPPERTEIVLKPTETAMFLSSLKEQ